MEVKVQGVPTGGFRLTIPASVVRDHIKAKADHHKNRVKFYKDKLVDLEEKEEEIQDITSNFSNSGYQSPVVQLRDRMNQHVRRGEFFDFLLKGHYEDFFELTWEDLTALEVGR